MQVMKCTAGRILEVRIIALGMHETFFQFVGAHLLHVLLFLKVCKILVKWLASSWLDSKSTTSFFAASLVGWIRIAMANDASGIVPKKQDI